MSLARLFKCGHNLRSAKHSVSYLPELIPPRREHGKGQLMISKTYSFGLLGLDAYPVEIEIDVANGLPAVNLVGLADTAIKESKERVRSAIKNSGFQWPAQRITVNLAPSDINKNGAEKQGFPSHYLP